MYEKEYLADELLAKERCGLCFNDVEVGNDNEMIMNLNTTKGRGLCGIGRGGGTPPIELDDTMNCNAIELDEGIVESARVDDFEMQIQTVHDAQVEDLSEKFKY